MTSVAHVINSLETGGAEMQLAMYLRHTRIVGQQILRLEPGRSDAVRVPEGTATELVVPSRSSDLSTVYRLARVIRRLEPSAVVCCWDFRPFVLGAAAGRLSGRRTVANVRNVGIFYTPVHRAAERVALRLAKIVVTNSLASQRRIRSVTHHAECLRIPNGIELHESDRSEVRSRVRGDLGCTGEDLVFVSVGGLDPVKGQEILLDAFSSCSPLDRMTLVLVGRGVSTLDCRVAALGLESRVRLVEDTDRVHEYLLAADVYVMASLSEGMSNALMEALASGLPAIVTDVAGVEDLLEAGAALRVVPSGQRDALAAEMRATRCNPLPLVKSGAECARAIRETFSAARMAAAYDSLFARLMHGGSRA